VIDETLTDIKRRYGKVSYPEVSEARDNLFGEISVKGSEEKKGSYISIEKIEKKEQKKFIGLKKEEAVEFEVEKALADEAERARALNLSEEEAKQAKGTYVFTVTSVSRVETAELNQELFDKVFGSEVVKTEEEFLSKIRETITENYKRETDHLLDHEIQHYFVDNTKISMPDNFLKTWLKNTSAGKVTDEVLEKEFSQYKESLKWDLIKNQITEEKSITVEGDEVREKAKKQIIEQFGGESIAAQLGSKLDDIANNFLSGQDGKGENFMRIYNQLRHEKIMKVVKEAITINEKKVSLDEFKKIAASHNH
jgi:trigger factor